MFGKIHGPVEIIDFYTYQPAQKYNCIVGDIWADFSGRHLNKYLQFKTHTLSLLKEGGQLLGWGNEYFEYLLDKSRKEVLGFD